MVYEAVLAIGVGVVLLHSWRQWHGGKAMSERLKKERPPVPELSATPKVSVLVAAWNEGPNAEEVIDSFKPLDYPIKRWSFALEAMMIPMSVPCGTVTAP